MKTTFKIIDGTLHEYDSNENLIHRKSSDGYESWREYDSNGNLIHYKHSSGFESWYDSNGKKITKKEFEEVNHASLVKKVVGNTIKTNIMGSMKKSKYELVLIIVFMIVMMCVGSEIQQRVDRNIAIEHNVACWSINATNGESQFTWKVMSGN